MSSILLDHGEGGAATARLVHDVFLRHLGAPASLEDAAVLDHASRIAFTTDSFVVQPIEFPGGDIGRLAVCGTVNDLAVVGATPLYLSAAFILEEGLPIDTLGRVVESMARTAHEAGVRVVTGDTKVVRRGQADGLYITTSGVGAVRPEVSLASTACVVGDVILVSGAIAEHGTAVLVAREGLGIRGDLVSDCQPLGNLARSVLSAAPHLRCMRDPTRGGLATSLVEIATASNVRIELDESSIPIREPVAAVCNLLGLDPLYVACEGRLVAVVPANEADAALEAMRHSGAQGQPARIGSIVGGKTGLFLRTVAGGVRPLVALEGSQLPRIC